MYYDIRTHSDVKKYEKHASGKPLIIWYYADWCGHCKDMEPAWEHFKKKCKDVKISLAKINSDAVKHLKKDPEVQGYPTIQFHNNGKKQSEFNSDRTPEELLKFTLDNMKNIKKSKKKKRRKSTSNSKKIKSKGKKTKKRKSL